MKTEILILSLVILLILVVTIFLIRRKICVMQQNKVFAKRKAIDEFLNSTPMLFYPPKVLKRMGKMEEAISETKNVLNNWDEFTKQAADETKKEAYGEIDKSVGWFDPSFGMCSGFAKVEVNQLISFEKLYAKLDLSIMMYKVVLHLNFETLGSLYPFVKERNDFLVLIDDYLKEEAALYRLAQKNKIKKFVEGPKKRVEFFLRALNIDHFKVSYQYQFTIWRYYLHGK
jgi:hypothetical protein